MNTIFFNQNALKKGEFRIFFFIQGHLDKTQVLI